MKLGLISDIHGNHSALAAVMSVLKKEVSQILFCGDLAGYYPFVEECANLLEFSELIGVRGNHDDVLLKLLIDGQKPDEQYLKMYGSALERSSRTMSEKIWDFLKSLPVSKELVLSSKRVALYHGAPWDPLNGRVYPDFTRWQDFEGYDADYIILGHTHYPLLQKWQGTVIINPGSVGQPRDKNWGACFAELDLSSGQVVHKRVGYDPTLIICDAQAHDPDNKYLVEALGWH